MKERNIKKDEYKKIEDWMYEGKSFKQVARLLKISRRHFYDLMKEDEKLMHTVAIGKEYAEGWWEEEGQQNLSNKNYNSRLWHTNMRHRFGWDKEEEKKEKDETVPKLDQVTDAYKLKEY